MLITSLPFGGGVKSAAVEDGEVKSFAFEIKEATEQGIVRGYAAVTRNIDEGRDKIVPGAMTRSLKRSAGIMPMFWGHDWSRIPLGYGTEGAEDDKGLAVAGELTMDIGEVQDAYKSIVHAKKVGFKMGISIGYRTLDYEMEGDIRLLKEIDVFEWSLTPFPMNPKARVTTVKSIEDLTERDFEKYLRDGGFSAREAKTIISRGFRALKGTQRDVDETEEQLTGDELALKQFSEEISVQRWMADLRNSVRG